MQVLQKVSELHSYSSFISNNFSKHLLYTVTWQILHIHTTEFGYILGLTILYSQCIEIRFSSKLTRKQALEVLLNCNFFKQCWCLFGYQARNWAYIAIKPWGMEWSNWKSFLLGVYCCTMLDATICTIGYNLPHKCTKAELNGPFIFLSLSCKVNVN